MYYQISDTIIIIMYCQISDTIRYWKPLWQIFLTTCMLVTFLVSFFTVAFGMRITGSFNLHIVLSLQNLKQDWEVEKVWRRCQLNVKSMSKKDINFLKQCYEYYCGLSKVCFVVPNHSCMPIVYKDFKVAEKQDYLNLTQIYFTRQILEIYFIRYDRFIYC